MNSEPTSYEGHAFHPSLGDEVATGTITLDRWWFHFQCESAGVDLPMDDLRVQFSQTGDSRVLFRHSAQPEWTIYTEDDAILSHPVFAQRNDLRKQVTEVRNRGAMTRTLLATLIFFAVFGLGALLVTWISGRMVQSLAARVPVSWENQFGDKILEEVKLEQALINEPELQAKVEALAAPLLRVVPANGIKFKFHIADSPDPNAYALPGGHVVVNTGLLEMAGRPEEVAGVLAHEFAHVTRKHAFRHIVASAGPFVIFNIFAGGGGVMNTISAGSEFLVNQSFSQSYEREADEVGWQYLLAANIDPRGLADSLRKIQTMEEQLSFTQVKALSSHPATPERVERLEKKWEKLKHEGKFLDLEAEVRQAMTGKR